MSLSFFPKILKSSPQLFLLPEKTHRKREIRAPYVCVSIIISWRKLSNKITFTNNSSSMLCVMFAIQASMESLDDSDDSDPDESIDYIDGAGMSSRKVKICF